MYVGYKDSHLKPHLKLMVRTTILAAVTEYVVHLSNLGLECSKSYKKLHKELRLGLSWQIKVTHESPS